MTNCPFSKSSLISSKIPKSSLAYLLLTFWLFKPPYIKDHPHSQNFYQSKICLRVIFIKFRYHHVPKARTVCSTTKNSRQTKKTSKTSQLFYVLQVYIQLQLTFFSHIWSKKNNSLFLSSRKEKQQQKLKPKNRRGSLKKKMKSKAKGKKEKKKE